MNEFFVLGLVPGTNFQITFLMWSVAALIIATGGTLVWLYDIDIRLFVRNSNNHPMIYASQLHSRLNFTDAR